MLEVYFNDEKKNFGVFENPKQVPEFAKLPANEKEWVSRNDPGHAINRANRFAELTLKVGLFPAMRQWHTLVGGPFILNQNVLLEPFYPPYWYSFKKSP